MYMKTILTLIAFILISSVALAGEKHPSVTVTSTGEYQNSDRWKAIQ